jgi:O-methyltransferase
VVAEVTDERSWDFVPQAGLDLDAIRVERRAHLSDLKNTWWYVQRATSSSARAYYGDVEDLPAEIGRFDTSFLLAVLLHCRNPVAIVESVARRTDRRVVVTEPAWIDPAVGDAPVSALVPTAENGTWDTWWFYTPAFFVQLLGVMGFGRSTTTFHTQPYHGTEVPFFTVVAEHSHR